MKTYNFKMQWVWNINFNQEVSDMFKLLKIIGPRSLTEIVFLDSNYKKVSNYTDMVMHSDLNGYSAFRKHWNRLKKSGEINKIQYVEFVKR